MAPKDRSPCDGPDFEPGRPGNRAGLSQIAYRVTTQPEAFDRMLWRLPRTTITDPDTKATLHPLAALRTRDLEDPTISLIDAYAMACDVVSFYSERIAQEGYLGTATQRRSMLELARMIGYELAPGVAASAHLAFTVEDADDPYRTVEIATGVQAMSIPHEKGKLPQIFETVEDITARAEWNDIHARTTRPQNLVLFHRQKAEGEEEDARNGTLYLFDLDNSFDAAALSDPDLETVATLDALADFHPLTRRIDLPAALQGRIDDHEDNTEIKPFLYAIPVDEICLSGLGLNLRKGARILAVGQGADSEDRVVAMPFRVVETTEDRAFGITRAVVTRSGQAPKKVRRTPFFFLAKLVIGTMPTGRVPLDTQSVETHVRGRQWSGDGLSALVQSQAWQRTKLMTLIRLLVLPPPETDDGDDIALGWHVMRDSAGFFGNTAPRWDTLDYGGTETGKDKGPYTSNWDSAPNTILEDGFGELYHGEDAGETQPHVYLDREIKELQPNGWAILENGRGGTLGLRVTHAAAESRADYAITGKSTGVTFLDADGAELDLQSDFDASEYNDFKFRASQIHAVSEHLPLSGVPLSPQLDQGAASVELDRLYLDLERGRPVSLSGARNDAEGILGRETQIISEVQHIDGITRLLFDGETAYPYDRTTVRINANVALATHGETVAEDLGSGDARLTFQTFTLKKPPLTYVSAANETGRASTLEIRVDGALWDEVPALGEAGPEDAVYEVRQSDDGKTHVRFGDSRTGRRLPTGEVNISATCRSGIGFDGEVPEEAISQLKTRPLGVRSVVNPSPATGAGDPETLDSARLNAPGTVKTLGRIVSLTDYADFALTFAGVGKAQARELWSGQEKVVHLSVAPEADAELDESAPLMLNLDAAIGRVRDPARRFVLQPYKRHFFAMTATIEPDPAYLADDVELWARQKIEALFGYATRALAQPVSAAEIIAALHQATGVVSVDLDALAILLDGSTTATTGAELSSVLPSRTALGPGRRGTGDIFTPAELLTVLPQAITLTITEPADA